MYTIPGKGPPVAALVLKKPVLAHPAVIAEVIERARGPPLGQCRNGDGTCAPKGRANEDAVSAFMDGHFDVERAKTGQMHKHPGNEQLKGGKHPVIVQVKREALNKCTFSFDAGALQGRAGAARRVVQEGHRYWYKDHPAIGLRNLLAKRRE